MATDVYNENRWLNRLDQIIDHHLGEPGFGNGQLAAVMKISERHLSRKVKALSGLPPRKYLRRYRLKQALELLESGSLKRVKDASEAVGYSNTSYFISQFEKEFGKKPLEVLREKGWR